MPKLWLNSMQEARSGKAAQMMCLDTKMQKEKIIQKLREKGCRITKQRQMILEVILSEGCSSCKEIYYEVKKEDGSVGISTVYRMVGLLEEIGAICRENIYKIFCGMEQGEERTFVIEMDDHTVIGLGTGDFFRVLLEGLKTCGYADKQCIVSIALEPGLKTDG